jgi:hypothetical protein
MPARPRRARSAVLAAAALLLAGACGSGDDGGPAATTTLTSTTGRPASTTTSTTAAPADCPTFGALDERTAAPAVTREPKVALLLNVQVQASACVDEVAFTFAGGVPGYTVGYQEGPLTEDPSDRPMTVAGAGHLVARFEPAAGFDLSVDQAPQIYDGPMAMRPPVPSGIADLQRIGDFEVVLSWVAGVAERQPFEVVRRGEQLVVRLPAPAPRETRCLVDGDGFSVGAPADWFVELSDRWRCRYLDPEPFIVYPGTNDIRWAVTVQQADVDAQAFLERLEGSTGLERIDKRAGEVAGRKATILDLTENGEGMLPAGFQHRMYVVDAGARALTIMGRPAPAGPAVATNRAAVDAIAGAVRPA